MSGNGLRKIDYNQLRKQTSTVDMEIKKEKQFYGNLYKVHDIPPDPHE